MPDPVCPLCGSTRFDDYRGVAATRCRASKSNERTRVVKLFLDRYVKLRPGQRVLHFAPEISLGRHIAGLVGAGYEAADIARRFGQGDHMRRFGRDDFALTVGAVFGLTAAYSLTDVFPEADLRHANVRQSQRK